MTFGEKVKKARKELGLTQTELGDKIGVSRRTITSHEYGANLIIW
ncbi:helix-turn-helix transcriptional regulator [Parabacteroides goldsteinii]|nr:helix-turn-helix transcriptional regulator [Parabacteroides goldsteinii]